MTDKISKITNLIWDLIFPVYCLGCGKNLKNGNFLCPDCFLKININKTLFCGKCRARLPENKKICHLDFPYTLGAATSYSDEAVKELIHNLKFNGARRAAKPLGEILIKYLKGLDFNLESFLVIPVPLGKKRLRSRGFNQAELLAQEVSAYFNILVASNALVRNKETKPQTELKSFDERFSNLEESFFVSDEKIISNKNILLIDDVSTSGATLSAAASALKKSGAKKIIALVVALA
jgi:ComF family protein